jgi:hypothetical protein
MAQWLYDEKVPMPLKDFHCNACTMARSTHHIPKSLSNEKRLKCPFELIHTDMSGKFSTASLGDSKYFVIFINNCTQYAWAYFIKTKDKTLKMIEVFINMIKTQFNTTVKCVCSDNSGKYVNNMMKIIFIKHDILHKAMPLYNHEMNGVAERYNRTIITDA